MKGRTLFQAKRLLPMTRRERALASKLNETRAGLAAVATVVRNFSALEDARAHLLLKAAREGRTGVEGAAGDPAAAVLPGTVTTPIDAAVARSKRTAEILDRVTEALERLGASLREG